MIQELQVSAIAHVIQLAVAPVFLLTGVGAMLGVMANRLARVIDRSRVLEGQLPAAAPEDARDALVRWWDDQVGLDWDVVPPGKDDPAPPADPILERALGLLRDADALRAGGGR